ncbi:MAG: AAA family ATPase [Candidatus Pacearchaeota archaeon]|nr:AAA family ATPase [Candidatus Pacearchaeota archaeon]
MIIGIVGPIASGKDVVADILEKKGFIKLNLSSEVREEARARGIEINRKNLQDLGNEMRKKYGGGYWADRILKKMQIGKNYVISGIRNPEEILRFKLAGDFILIGVDAPDTKRFEWIKRRNKDSDPKTLEEIKAMDARDFGINEESYGQQVGKCMEFVEYKIINDGTLEELKEKVEDLLREII